MVEKQNSYKGDTSEMAEGKVVDISATEMELVSQFPS